MDIIKDLLMSTIWENPPFCKETLWLVKDRGEAVEERKALQK